MRPAMWCAVMLICCCSVAAFAAEKAKPAVPSGATAAAAAANALPKGFTDADAWEKVDPDLQQAYKDAMTAGDPLRRFDCFVRDQNQIDPGDRDFLQSKGFNVRTVGGNVASGNLKAQDLPSVAGLPFVVKVRFSKQPGGN